MSANRKRSVKIHGHQTSFSLEDEFWNCLKLMAREKSIAVSALIGSIDQARGDSVNLSSQIRLSVLNWALSRQLTNFPQSGTPNKDDSD